MGHTCDFIWEFFLIKSKMYTLDYEPPNPLWNGRLVRTIYTDLECFPHMAEHLSQTEPGLRITGPSVSQRHSLNVNEYMDDIFHLEHERRDIFDRLISNINFTWLIFHGLLLTSC